MSEKWTKPRGAQLDENEEALRRMRVIVWIAAAILLGGLCLWAGLFVGYRFGFGG